MWSHWPEKLLIALLLVGTLVPAIFVNSVTWYWALIPAGWVAAFLVYYVVMLFDRWIFNYRKKRTQDLQSRNQ